MKTAHLRAIATIVVYLLVAISLGSCDVSGADADCSRSDLAQTDRIAEGVWQTLDSSSPSDKAYCNSSPYPYVGGSMNDSPAEIIARAPDELGCEHTSVQGFDPEDSAVFACDFKGTSYLLEITREPDPSGRPGTEVGVYRR